MNKDELKTSEEPLVSVVLCFHNEEEFIREAIQSVIAQDYRHWELWLVDDGSVDESTGIAKSYVARYPEKVFYLDHPYHQNKGVSASRNAGIRKCTGVYVAFLNAGDTWFAGKLRSQVDIFRRNPGVTVVMEASLCWNSWRDAKEADIVVPVGVSEGVYRAPQLALALYPLGSGAAPRASGIMVQRAALRRCLFEELFRGIFRLYEDQAFLSKVYVRETVLVSGLCHNRSRQHAEAPESAAYDSGNYHKVRNYFLYWFRDYLRAQPLRYKRVERLLRRAQMRYREPLMYKVLVDVPQRLRKIFIRLLIRTGIVKYSESW